MLKWEEKKTTPRSHQLHGKITRKKNHFKRFKADADRQIHYALIGLRSWKSKISIIRKLISIIIFFSSFSLCVSRVLSVPIYIDAYYIWVENIDEKITEKKYVYMRKPKRESERERKRKKASKYGRQVFKVVKSEFTYYGLSQNWIYSQEINSIPVNWIEQKKWREKKNTHTNIPAYLILREYTQMYISLDKK